MKFQMPSRRILIWSALGVLVLLGLVLGFRAPPVLVDSAEVKRGHFQVIVEDEGRTRIPDRFEVAAPVTGQLARVLLEPGDAVSRGSRLFTVNPLAAPALDARARAQAESQLARADAALAAARTQVEAEAAAAGLAEAELVRVAPLVDEGHLPREALDRARTQAQRAQAALRSARFAADVARHERDIARSLLAVEGGERAAAPVAVESPIDGTVLLRHRQSEGAVQAGEAILTVGQLDSLEVEVDVLSPDAVRLRPGMRVELERWGGERVLPGRIARIEPAGFTRISALGVEEQRVWVIVALDAPREAWAQLGDAYRVEARFIVWEGDDVVHAPASAVFREGDRWGAFVVDGNRARHRAVRIGRRSGLEVELIEGLAPGERVVLHPGDDIEEGARIRLR